MTFGTPEFVSLKPDAANAYYAEVAGKNVKQAQKRMVELLADPEGSATGNGAPLRSEPEAIQHPVKFFEKGDRPLEYLTTRQWFARLVDKRDAMLAKGDEIQWHPPHSMRRVCRNTKMSFLPTARACPSIR